MFDQRRGPIFYCSRHQLGFDGQYDNFRMFDGREIIRQDFNTKQCPDCFSLGRGRVGPAYELAWVTVRQDTAYQTAAHITAAYATDLHLLHSICLNEPLTVIDNKRILHQTERSAVLF